MAEFYFDNLAKNLPDAYKKDSSSNNFKILELERATNVEYRAILYEINDILNIDNATGATLDMYGKKYGQARGKATDAQYRIMIKSKVVRGWCNGSYKNIVDALAKTFSCSVDNILIRESGDMAVSLDKIPLSAIINAGFSTAQAEKIVKNILPVGVELESVLFEGTFEFGSGSIECPSCGAIISERKYCANCVDESGNPVKGKMILTEADYDESAGFSEGENGTIGGYLGWTSSQESIDELPI